MANPILGTANIVGIAEPHQSTVAGILRAVGLGLFTAAEADIFIDRVRAHVTALPIELPLSIEDSPLVTVSERGSSILPHSPDRTV